MEFECWRTLTAISHNLQRVASFQTGGCTTDSGSLSGLIGNTLACCLALIGALARNILVAKVLITTVPFPTIGSLIGEVLGTSRQTLGMIDTAVLSGVELLIIHSVSKTKKLISN